MSERTLPAAGQAPSMVRSGAHTLASNIVRSLLAFGTTALVARALGPGGKGAFDLYTATSNLLAIGLGFSLQAGVIYVVAQGGVDLRALRHRLGMIALLQGVLALVLLSALSAAGFGRALLPQSEGAWVRFAIALTVGVAALGNAWRAMLVGRHRFIEANRLDVLRTGAVLALTAGVLAFAALRHLGPPVAGVILASTLAGALVLPSYLFLIPDANEGKGSRLSRVVSYSLTCHLGNTTQFLNYRLDAFLVNAMAGQAALGLYQLPVTLVEALRLLPASAAMITLPAVAAAQRSPLENALRTAQVGRFVLWFSAATGLALGISAPWLLPWIFGAAFAASVPALLWLLPGIVVFTIASVLSSHLAGMGMPRINVIISGIGLAVTVPLDLLLIPRIGIVGAAMASSASYTISAVLTVAMFQRTTGVPLARILVLGASDWLMVRRFFPRRGAAAT